MKGILICCLSLLVATSISHSTISPHLAPKSLSERDARSFLAGLNDGLDQDIAFEHLEKCIQSRQLPTQHILNAIQHFVHRNVQDVTQGIAELAQVVQLIPQAALECNTPVHDLDTLLNMLEFFAKQGKPIRATPEKVAVRGIDITKELASGTVSFVQKDFKKSGKQFGRVIAKVFYA